MVTVSHLVKNYIESHPFLLEALSRGIINHAALAEHIIPRIQKELKKEVRFSAVNMAIRRFGESLENHTAGCTRFDATCDVSIRSDLIEFALHKTDEAQQFIKNIHEQIDVYSGDVLTITRGLHEIMIITNKKYEFYITQKLSEHTIKKTISDLASITITIPENAAETQGYFYIITRALSWENINIVEIVSTLTEMTLLLSENDVGRSFDIIKRVMKNNRTK